MGVRCGRERMLGGCVSDWAKMPVSVGIGWVWVHVGGCVGDGWAKMPVSVGVGWVWVVVWVMAG